MAEYENEIENYIEEQDQDEKETSEMSQVNQLLERITEEVQNAQPENVIYFIVDFLCKFYPNHVHGLASVFAGDPALEYEKMAVMEFLKGQKIPGEIAGHFISSGFDTLETLETVSPENILEVEEDNGAKWATGHKVRVHQVFADAPARIKAFKDEKEAAIRSYLTYNPPIPQVPIQNSLYMTQSPAYPTNAFATNYASMLGKPVQQPVQPFIQQNALRYSSIAGYKN